MSQEKMILEVTFNRSLANDGERERFVKLLADELVNVYGPMEDAPEGYGERIVKRGWGMGQSMVIGLKQIVKPPRALMNQDLVVKLDGTTGASWPNDPIKGRFILRGKVVEGIKAALGRTVRIDLTFGQADHLRDGISDAMIRSPRCGVTPETEESED